MSDFLLYDYLAAKNSVDLIEYFVTYGYTHERLFCHNDF